MEGSCGCGCGGGGCSWVEAREGKEDDDPAEGAVDRSDAGDRREGWDWVSGGSPITCDPPDKIESVQMGRLPPHFDR
jgi:hypothetical protein